MSYLALGSLFSGVLCEPGILTRPKLKTAAWKCLPISSVDWCSHLGGEEG